MRRPLMICLIHILITGEYLKTNEDNIYIDKMPLNIVYVGELMKFFLMQNLS